ncbi:MAG TPA: STAS/SEC14 domain-containing protein [Pseudomonadota bacterium]|nr:STAS/SEC14 domain-containing protein [Pseudomonadota bacterium]
MSDEWLGAGRQCWQLQGDTILSRWAGVCTLEELEPFLAFCERCAARTDGLFLIVDNTRAGPGRPDVRRRLVDWSRHHTHFGGVAIYGGDLATRAIGKLVINALALLTGRKLNIVIVADEAAARAWIGERRIQRRAERATSPTSPS